MKFQQNFCVVDSSLRLLWVGGDWDEFARRNGGTRCLANSVLSTPLTAHITDDLTAGAVVKMVQTVIRLHQPLKLDYRCDSASEIRRFRMTVQPLKDARALIVHDLRDAELLSVPMQSWRFDPHAESRKCSMCCAVEMGDDWVDPIHLTTPHPPTVSFILCPHCRDRVDGAIRAAQSGAVAPVPFETDIGKGLSVKRDRDF